MKGRTMNVNERIFHAGLGTPLGSLGLWATDAGLRAVTWEHDPRSLSGLGLTGDSIESDDVEAHPLLSKTAAQLRDYFSGKRRDFDLPLDLRGTEFQLAVWRALTHIAFGGTRSYLDLARSLRRPTASRAVGGAVGANPVGIIVPCHRVVGASGRLTGFAGGLEAKRFLLALEGVPLRGDRLARSRRDPAGANLAAPCSGG